LIPTQVRGRSVAYVTVLGAIVALLAAGLAIPYVFGHPEHAAQAKTNTDLGALGSEGLTTETTTAAAGAAAAGAPGAAGAGGAATGGAGFGRPGAAAAAAAGAGGAAASGGGTVPGLNDKEVRLGIPIFDLGVQIPVEGLDPAEQRNQWNSYIDTVNKAGGVQGRKLVPVYSGYNPLNPDSFRATCLALTENTQVFAVLGYGLFDNQAPCFARDHAVPVVNGIGVSDATMAASKGRILTAAIGKDRALRNHALLLNQLGVLKGKTVGIVTSTDRNDFAQVDATLVPLLRQLGVKIGHVSNLSSDQNTALAQMSIESRSMQVAGVNLVFLDANLVYSGYFVNAGEQQGYKPQYTTSDFEQLVQDGVTNPYTQGFDGAIGITALRSGEQRINQPEPAFDARCRQIYETAANTKYQRGQIQYETTMGMCSVVDITAKALALAGRFPTRDSFIAAGERLKDFELGYSAPGSFSPTKHDAPQQVRVARWRFDCKCWIPSGPFQPAPA